MIIGDSSQWDDLFQKDLVPTILSYIVETWEQMPKPGPSDLEDVISDRLYVALLNTKRRSYFPFHISREDLEFNLELAKETGRKDIVFYPSLNNQDVYLCIEAKRLNALISGVRRSLADEYVKKGMFRFVNRKYARYVKHGAMLAYVLDGNVERAIQNVDKNVIKCHAELRMNNKRGLLPSTVRPNDNRTKETHHHRLHDDTFFCMHHLFMAE